MLFTALLTRFSVSLATLGFFLATFSLATFATGVGVILGTAFTGCNSASFGTPVGTSPIMVSHLMPSCVAVVFIHVGSSVRIGFGLLDLTNSLPVVA